MPYVSQVNVGGAGKYGVTQENNFYPMNGFPNSPPPQPMSGYIMPPAAPQSPQVAGIFRTTSAVSLFSSSFKSLATFMLLLCTITVAIVVTVVVVTNRKSSGPDNDLKVSCNISGVFHCDMGDECLSISAVCDGNAQCSDSSDESNCTASGSTTATTQTTTTQTTTTTTTSASSAVSGQNTGTQTAPQNPTFPVSASTVFVNGSAVLSNIPYDDELADTNSTAFKDLSDLFCSQIKTPLSPSRSRAKVKSCRVPIIRSVNNFSEVTYAVEGEISSSDDLSLAEKDLSASILEALLHPDNALIVDPSSIVFYNSDGGPSQNCPSLSVCLPYSNTDCRSVVNGFACVCRQGFSNSQNAVNQSCALGTTLSGHPPISETTTSPGNTNGGTTTTRSVLDQSIPPTSLNPLLRPTTSDATVTRSTTFIWDLECDPVFEFKCNRTGFCFLKSSICDFIQDCEDGSDENNCTYRECNANELQCNNSQCAPIGRQCDERYDCYDGSDEWNCPCDETTQFKCNSTGMCINIQSKCNGYWDCPDGSDEPTNCTCQGGDKFVCRDGRCVSSALRCNFYSNCYDGSDELNCTYPECNSTEFRCRNGQCIPETGRCNKRWFDCLDGSDEQFCPCNASYQFTCNSTGECISLYSQCDGYRQCPDNSDEINCTCDSEHQFQCGSFNPRCIALYQRCDVNYNCADRTDELECPCNSSDRFQCANGQCVKVAQRCDFYKNCDDGSDELNCNYPACYDTDHVCFNGQCIYGNASCNRYVQCADKSDELFCPCDTMNSEFMCENGQCIGRYERCNKYSTYCDDGSDEWNCSTECAGPHHTCYDGFCLYTRDQCQSGWCSSYICDGFIDCPDESDEMNCSSRVSPATTTRTTVPPQTTIYYTYPHFTTTRDPTGNDVVRTDGSVWPTTTSSGSTKSNSWAPITDSTTTRIFRCPFGQTEFKCASSDKCIFIGYRCDGGMDCEDGSDESCYQAERAYHQDDFLVFTSNQFLGLYQFEANASYTPVKVKQMLAKKPSNPRAVAVDRKSRYIYWTDQATKKISRLSLATQHTSVVYTHMGEMSNFEGLSVDTVSNKLYYTFQNVSEGYIGELNMDSGVSRVLWKKNQSNPRSVVIEPGTGRLYWTECGQNPAIVMTTVENSGYITALVQTNINLPNSLAIDFIKSTMYWVDMTFGIVEAAKLDGSKRRTIVQEYNSVYHAITISASYIYVADYSAEYIKRFNRYSNAAKYIYLYPPYSYSGMPGIAYFGPMNSDDEYCKGPGSYQCANSWCISAQKTPCGSWWCPEWKVECDGFPDCPDASDELNCTSITVNTTCGLGEFECADGRCVGLNEICQGYQRCPDGSDISYCLYRGCPDDQFQCQNTARCLPSYLRCDGIGHCSDFSDELNCFCGSGQFKCANESMCVSESLMRCNGRNDCRDGSDEKNCVDCPVPARKFRCNSGACVSGSSRCSMYYSQCPDGSDNIGCDDCEARGGFLCDNGQCVPPLSRCDVYASPKCANQSHYANCTCTSNEFQCDNGQCAPSYSRCNWFAQSPCSDNSHLKGCNETCTSYDFQCDSGQCVNRGSWCNVYNYSVCTDKSDRKYCKCAVTDIYCDRDTCVDITKWCNGEEDCADGYDERNCYFGNCPPNYFSCDAFAITTTPFQRWSNKTECVPLGARCDGKVDCANSADEINCPCDSTFQFRCDSGRCINGSVWCDGNTDCLDGSDEPPDCSNQCNPNRHFSCDNGRCVEKYSTCDGINNCGDYSDEKNCSSCYYGDFQCDMGMCIDRSVFCNGTRECPDGSDEKEDCEYMCQPEYFTCNNSRCVEKSRLCSGVNDCGDYSDEINCDCQSRSNQFRCDMGFCVNMFHYCDGYRECPDGSDEKPNCQSECPENFFLCNATGKCFTEEFVCDKTIDCPDGSDEMNCNCTSEQYKCTSGNCIPQHWLCDGTADCAGGDDESSSTCDVCTGTQHKCFSDRNCVQLDSVCDGVSHCNDSSDESYCFESGEAGAVVNGYETKILKVKFRGVTDNYICADEWNETWSDQICVMMGYSSAAAFSSSTGPSGTFTTIKAIDQFMVEKHNILANFEPTSCSSRKVLGLNCTNLECGKRKVAADSVGPYIVNGMKAAPGAWPWQAGILSYNFYICGGVVLNKRWILTAAHCLDNYNSPFYLLVGVGSTRSKMNDSNAVISSVDLILKHPTYVPRNVTFEGDIALLRLSKALVFNDYIQPICLPAPSVDQRQYKVCVAAGFGDTRNDIGLVTEYLVQGKMMPMTEADCRKAYSDVSGYPPLPNKFNDHILCAGGFANEFGVFTCSGDSGGPLACKDAYDNWSVLGITSVSNRCRWSAFTRVSAYLSWIEDTMDMYAVPDA